MDSTKERRTVIVSGVPAVLPSSRMADKLVIHFQRSRSHGGDVQHIQYPTNITGVAFVTFDRVQDAEGVLKTDHLLEDKEFADVYPLTVFKFTEDVFFFLRAEVDLSMFGDPEGLIQTLKTRHRSVRFFSLSSKGVTVVEGPFKAMKELREDLIRQTVRSPDWSGEAVATKCMVSLVGGSQEDSTWVDASVFRYIQQFQHEELAGCFHKNLVEVKTHEQGDLTQIILSGPSRSLVRKAKSDLELLLANWLSILRIQKLDYMGLAGHQRERLLGFCSDAHFQYSDVLFVPLETHVEVVGPSESSYAFCRRVEVMMHAYDRQPSRNGASLNVGSGS